MEKIVIRNIPGFPGYGATRDGRIWSDKMAGHWMKPRRDTGGYLQVNLYQEGKETTKSVHRLVAGAFIPNPESKSQVNHVNGSKTDNRVDNLEWTTSSENNRHAYDTGLMGRGEDNVHSKLALAQVQALLERYSAGGVTQRELSSEYGVSQPQVSRIVRGKTWRGA